MKYAFIITIIVLCSFSWVTESHSLTIGPARLEVRLPAGEVAVADYYVQNETENPLHVSVEPESWYGSIYDYKGLQAKDWIKAEPAEFDIKPKEIKKIAVKIKVPTNMSGELVAQIFFASLMPGSDNTAGAGIQSRVGAILYVAIKDTEKVKAKIESINVSETIAKGNKEVAIKVTVANEGNIHILPESGRVLVKSEESEQVVQLPLLTKQEILPKRNFTYTAIWNNPVVKEGKYTVFCEIKYGKMYGREKTAKLESSFEADSSGKVMPK